MRPRTLLVLFVVVLALGAFIWFYERELPSSEERAELEKKVLRVEPDEVTAVTLQSDAGTVRLEKVEPVRGGPDEEREEESAEVLAPEAEWRLVEPLQARADTLAVEGLLTALTSLQKSRTLEEMPAEEAGLASPRATVRLRTEEGERVLKIGDPVPPGGSTLASVEGRGEVYVVSESVLPEIRRQPGDWRDRRMFRGQRDEVRRITLISRGDGGGSGQRVVLAQKDGPFRLESPVADRAERDRVDDLFAELSGLTAERFVDPPHPPLAELGLQPPRAVVEVAFEEGPPARIEIGAPMAETEEGSGETAAGPVYARVGGQVFEARTRLAEAASRPAAEWRAQTLSAFDVFQVDSFTVQDAQGKLVLHRAEPDWKRGEETISYLPVSDFLYALTSARAERLLPPAEARALGIDLSKPALTVTLKGEEAGEETLTLFPGVAAGVPARASGRDLVLLLPGGTLSEIQGKFAEVRKAEPVEPPR